MSVRFYGYDKCGTCKKAEQWLKQQGIAYEKIPIREQTPSTRELERALARFQDNKRKLFNTSGQDYRALKVGERLAGLNDAEIIGMLHGNGNLIKRPFVISKDVILVGFDEEAWAAALR